MPVETRNRIARNYVAAFGANGARTYIENLETSVDLCSWGTHVLPMTINDGAPARTFICSPRVGYIDYPREELSRFPNKTVVPVLRAIISGTGLFAPSSLLDRVVHINNWMMSTNLPLDLDPSLARSQTLKIAEHYPEHLLAMRSLTMRYNAELIAALKASGWVLLPSRQVFLVDDVARQSLTCRDSKRDAKLWRRGAYAYEELDEIGAVDADRIIELYNQLYRVKYSALNPAYTARFVALTQGIGMIRYLILRDDKGVIQAFGGMHRFGCHATMPLIGYNTELPQEHGLYRLASNSCFV